MGELVHKLRHLHVHVRSGREVVFTDGHPVALQVLLDIRPAVENPQAPPLDLRVVVDRSGSMKGEKLEAVMRALQRVISTLTVRDTLTIISFATDYSVDLGKRHMDDRGREHAHTVVTRLRADGNTHISGALNAALEVPEFVDTHETRVILFTDGQSNVNTQEDHRLLARAADEARRKRIPLFIYGTGSDYHFALLQQMAVMAGNGSQLRHVMEAEALEREFAAEIGFMRGVGVRGLTVTAVATGSAKIARATRFMPQQADLEPMHRDTLITDFSGAVDKARGQQYLIELTADPDRACTCEVMRLTLKGRTVAGESFEDVILVRTHFTTNRSEETVPDPEIVKLQIKMAAAAQAEAGNFDRSAELYTRSGDERTAVIMRDLGRKAHRDQEAARRGGTTEARTSVSVEFTARVDREDD